MGSPRYVVAPMVDQSDLAFRMLCKKYGAQLSYTPMFHSKIFVESAKYRSQMMQVCDDDYPLMLQFCGDDPETILGAAKMALDMADLKTTQNVIAAVDLNLGCPQQIARRGHYGSYLMEEQTLIRNIVSALHHDLPVPVSCKIRVFPDVNQTIAYAKMLEAAGCQILAVHGRTRDQRGHRQGLADWEQIRMVKQSVNIPIISNGNIRYLSDVDECMQQTGADAVMVADSILANPALFSGDSELDKVELTKEYLDICEEHLPPTTSCVRTHIFRFLREELKRQVDLRHMLAELSVRRNLNLTHKKSMLMDENDDSENSTPEERNEIIQKFRNVVDMVAEREREGEVILELGDRLYHKRTKKNLRRVAYCEAKKAKENYEKQEAKNINAKPINPSYL